MLFARTPLPPLVALPLAFWACSEAAISPDATAPRADAEASRDAAGLDAAMLDAEAMGFDAGMFFPDASVACAYPPNAVEPMARDQVLSPYAWPSGIDGARMDFPLDLAQAHCNTDPNRDWSPYNAILFVSMPSW